MSSTPFLKVHFFRTNSGNEPVREWLKTLDSEQRKIIGEGIKLVQFRWPLGMPLVKKLEPDIWEVRNKLQTGIISRVFFTVCNGQIILLHGFIKKTQKTPKKELERARSRKNQRFNEESKK